MTQLRNYGLWYDSIQSKLFNCFENRKIAEIISYIKCGFRFPLQLLTETFLRCDKCFVSFAQVVARNACRNPYHFFPCFDSPWWARASSVSRLHDHNHTHTALGRNPLDEWQARRRDLYRTTHNTHNRQTFMPRVRFEPTNSAGERPKTYALDRAATGPDKLCPLCL